MIVPRKHLRSLSITKVTLVHVLIGAITLAMLFLTVHNRNTNSAAFEKQWVDSSIFDDRWNDLSDHWRTNGWWANGGMYYLNQCKWFSGGKQGGGLRIWLGDTIETDLGEEVPQHYFYRSNTMLWLIPLHITQSAVVQMGGGLAKRWVSVLHNQVWIMMTAVLFGLSGTLLARHMRFSWAHCLLLGITSQIVLQTLPINLNSYWGFYMQHAFALMMMAVLLALIWPGRNGRVWLRVIGVIGLFVADLPHAIMLIAGWAILNLAINHRLFRQQRWLSLVIIPSISMLFVLSMQYVIVMFSSYRPVFLGSGLLFRTGLDGDVSIFQSLWSGSFGFIFRSPISHHGPDGVEHAVIWIAGGIAGLAVMVICSRRKELGRVSYTTAFLAASFLPFFILFPNAVAIHPYAYPVIAVPLMVFSLIIALPIALDRYSARRWPLLISVAFIGLTLTAANLRTYATTRPLNADDLLISLPSLTHDQMHQPPHDRK
mgnify:CR=1 FL=1